jgi:hypothetical protein
MQPGQKMRQYWPSQNCIKSHEPKWPLEFTGGKYDCANNLVKKLRTMGILTDKKTKHTRRVLTEEKWLIEGQSLQQCRGTAFSTPPVI